MMDKSTALMALHNLAHSADKEMVLLSTVRILLDLLRDKEVEKACQPITSRFNKDAK